MSIPKQGTPEWIEFRKKKIGASDAPVIVGVSPWSTPYKLWCQKLSLMPDTEKNAAMTRGLEMEETARKEFEKQTGHIMFKPTLVSQEYGFMMASYDGMDIEQKFAVEIKCPGKMDHASAMDGVVPEKYIPQLQHQMIVAKLEMIFYFSYDGNSSKIIEVEQDKNYQKNLIAKELEFWKYLQDKEAPPFVEKDYVERNETDWLVAASQWMHISSQIKKLEEEEDRLRKKLIALSENANSKGAGIKLSKILRKGNVDYTAIPELKQINLDEYRKPSTESWRLVKAI